MRRDAQDRSSGVWRYRGHPEGGQDGTGAPVIRRLTSLSLPIWAVVLALVPATEAVAQYCVGPIGNDTQTGCKFNQGQANRFCCCTVTCQGNGCTCTASCSIGCSYSCGTVNCESQNCVSLAAAILGSGHDQSEAQGFVFSAETYANVLEQEPLAAMILANVSKKTDMVRSNVVRGDRRCLDGRG